MIEHEKLESNEHINIIMYTFFATLTNNK